MLLDALLHSPILVQAFSNRSSGKGLADSEAANPNLISVPLSNRPRRGQRRGTLPGPSEGRDRH